MPFQETTTEGSVIMTALKRLGSLALGAIAALALSSAASAQEKLNFRLDWQIYGTHAPFFLAKEKGYYAAEKLDVTLSEGQGAGMVAKLLSEGTDPVGFLDYGTMMKGIGQGLPLKAIFGINQSSPMIILSHADNPIKTPKELEGKIVAMAPAESTAQIFPALLAAAGIEPNKVSVINPAVGAKNALFLQKRADAITAYVNVQVAQLEAQGAKTSYFFYSQYGVDTMANGIAANADWLAKNPDIAKRFLRATAKGWTEAKKDPDAAIAAVLKAYPQLEGQKAVLRRQLDFSFPLLETPATKGKPLGWMAKGDWEKMLEVLSKYGDLKNPKPAEQYYTNDFVPQ